MGWTSEWSKDVTLPHGSAPEGSGKGVSQQERRKERNRFRVYFTSISWHPSEPDDTRLALARGRPEHTCNTGVDGALLKLTCMQLFTTSTPSHLPPKTASPLFPLCCSAPKPSDSGTWKSLLNLVEGKGKAQRGKGRQRLFAMPIPLLTRTESWQFNSEYLLSSSHTQTLKLKSGQQKPSRNEDGRTKPLGLSSPARIILHRTGGRGSRAQNQVVCIKFILKEGRETKTSFNIHQTLTSLSQDWIGHMHPEIILKLLDQMLRLGTRHVTFNIFLSWFWPVSLGKNSYKPVVLKPGWLILRLTWGLKIRDSQFLPHPELFRIFGHGTLEYMLLKAPHVILLSAWFWNGGFRAHPKQISMPDLEPHWIQNGNLHLNKHPRLFWSEYCELWAVNTRKRWISGFKLEVCVLLVQSFIYTVPINK